MIFSHVNLRNLHTNYIADAKIQVRMLFVQLTALSSAFNVGKVVCGKNDVTVHIT